MSSGREAGEKRERSGRGVGEESGEKRERRGRGEGEEWPRMCMCMCVRVEAGVVEEIA